LANDYILSRNTLQLSDLLTRDSVDTALIQSRLLQRPIDQEKRGGLIDKAKERNLTKVANLLQKGYHVDNPITFPSKLLQQYSRESRGGSPAPRQSRSSQEQQQKMPNLPQPTDTIQRAYNINFGQLQTIDSSGIRVSSNIFMEIGDQKLRTVAELRNINDDNLESTFQTLGLDKHLTTLIIRSSSLTDNSCATLIKYLPKYTKLRYFVCMHSNFTIGNQQLTICTVR